MNTLNVNLDTELLSTGQIFETLEGEYCLPTKGLFNPDSDHYQQLETLWDVHFRPITNKCIDDVGYSEVFYCQGIEYVSINELTSVLYRMSEDVIGSLGVELRYLAFDLLRRFS